jgi:sugar phosphate isomerase/epimerase
MYKVGINIMGLFNELHEDLWGTLKALKEAGYDFVEIPADYGADPKMLEFYRKMCDGKKPGWSHEDLENNVPRMREMGFPLKSIFVFTTHILEQTDQMGTLCEKYGIETAVFSIMDIGDNTDKCYEYVELLNKTARQLKRYPLKLCLHNHEIDFVQILDKEGRKKPIFEILLDECPDYGIELDIGWLFYADVNAEDFFKRYGSRIHYLHIKDIHKNYKGMDRDKIFVPAGDGMVDIPFFTMLGEKYINREIVMITDQDNSRMDIFKDNLLSVKYLKEL